MTAVVDRRDPLWPARLVYYAGVVLVGFVTVRPILGLTISDLVFFAALALALLARAIQAAVLGGSVPRLIVEGSIVFGAGALISSTRAIDPIGSVGVTARVLYIAIVWFWLGLSLLRKEEHLRIAVACWLASVAINGMAAVGQLYFGNIIPGTRIGMGRMTGFTQHVNDLGAMCSIALVPAVNAASERRHALARIVVVVTLMLVVLGLLLSGSVGAWIAALAALGVWMIVGAGRRRLALALVGASLVVALAVMAVASITRPPPFLGARPSPIDRVQTVIADEPGEQQGSFWLRVEGYRQAWERIQRDPLVGVGLDAASAQTPNGIGVHNLILGAWYQAGILGLAGMVLVLLGVAVRGIQLVRTGSKDYLASALVASTVAFGIYVMGAPVLTQRYAWIGPALMLVAAGLLLRRAERADQADETASSAFGVPWRVHR